MDKEENLRMTLLHVVEWLYGGGQTWKPVNADFANKICEICHEVAKNDTPLEEAINKLKT